MGDLPQIKYCLVARNDVILADCFYSDGSATAGIGTLLSKLKHSERPRIFQFREYYWLVLTSFVKGRDEIIYRTVEGITFVVFLDQGFSRRLGMTMVYEMGEKFNGSFSDSQAKAAKRNSLSKKFLRTLKGLLVLFLSEFYGFIAI